MAEAFERLGDDIKQNGDDIFENYEIDIGELHCPKKVLGWWK